MNRKEKTPVIHASEGAPQKAGFDLKTLGRLLSYIKDYKGQLIFVVVCILLSAIASAASSLFLQSLIDDYIVPMLGTSAPVFHELLKTLIVIGIIYLIGVVSTLFYNRVMVTIAQGTLKKIRDEMFEKMQRLPIRTFDTRTHGDIMSLYTNDLDTIQECFGDGVLMFFDAMLLGLLAVIKMWRMDHLLTLLSLIPMVFLLVVGSGLGKVMVKKWEERQQAFSDLSDFAQESYSGIAVIKAFVKEYKELNAFRKLNRENEDINVTYTRISTLLNIMVTLFVESVICVILGYGGYLVYQGKFNAGQLVEYIGYFSAIVWPIMAVAMLIEKTSRGKASLNRVSELLDAEIHVKDRPGAKEIEHIKGKIEFKNLTFRYPGGEYDVLKNVSFVINPGERVGIVGKTGAGKTTLVDLILRTYNVKDGTLFIDDQDVNDLTIHSVREGCA